MVGIKRGIRELLMLVPCHRKPERCFYFKGKPMPICARCMSILLGYLFIPLLFFCHLPIWLGVCFQIPMVIDGYTQLKGWRTSNNFLRTITGLGSGFGLSVIVVAMVRFLISM